MAALAIIPVGISTGRHDERVAAAGPAQQATVLSVEVDKWSKNEDLTITVAHPDDGSAVAISGAADLDPVPKVGNSIPVIVDPDDPSNVLAADADWVMHWYWYALVVVIGLVLAGMFLGIALG